MINSTPARSGLTLLEVMIATLIMAVVMTAMNQILISSANLQSTAEAKDTLSSDIAKVFKQLNSDLNQSMWYIPDSSASFSTPTLMADRGLFYCPYVVQTSFGDSPSGEGFASDPLLALFNRNNPGDTRLDKLTVAGISDATLDDVLPGKATDRAQNPSTGVFQDGTYQTSYFARSQDLIFVRASTAAWDFGANRPRNIGGQAPRDLQAPTESFPGNDADWQTPGKENDLQVLFPSPFVSSISGTGVTTWQQRANTSLPYGKVMESVWLDNDFTTQPQLELNHQPTFSSFTKSDVRLLGYQVVPSPIGMGRLVRTYAVRSPATLPVKGTEPGQYIAKLNNDYLLVDKVISDHVVRIVFETARHSDTLGINGIRATIFFARVSDRQRSSALILRRSVTMIFGMRAQNTPTDQELFRSIIKTSTTAGTGAIPFSY